MAKSHYNSKEVSQEQTEIEDAQSLHNLRVLLKKSKAQNIGSNDDSLCCDYTNSCINQ